MVRAGAVACVFVVVLVVACAGASWTPVVILHGIDADRSTMDPVVQWIEEDLPGVYVKNVEIGDGARSSIFMTMNDQVQSVCDQLAADPQLRGRKINVIGYSQGGLTMRGYVERCNAPAVNNLITWSSPHMGVFGFLFPNSSIMYDLVRTVARAPYIKDVQHLISFAQYWKDPYALSDYLAKSEYLADINNERSVNATYKARLSSLSTFVQVMSMIDEIVVPRDSPWFNFFAERSSSQEVPMRESQLYLQDWIGTPPRACLRRFALMRAFSTGLRTLDQRGALKQYATNCLHQDYPTDKCRSWYTKFTLPYLQTTV